MASIDSPRRRELRIFESLEELSTNLAEYVAVVSEISVQDHDCFTVAMSGGIILSLLGKLCEAPYDKTVEWSRWLVFFADELAAARNHDGGNYRQAKEMFLSKVPIIQGHVFAINDGASPKGAAKQYEFVIRQLVKSRKVAASEVNDCPRFDLVLMSMGADGHVASLFPCHMALAAGEEWVTHITDAPEYPPERVTFTLPVINSASNVAVVAAGRDAAAAVEFAVGSESSLERKEEMAGVPASMVRPTDGRLVWFLDAFASSRLVQGDQ